jgi:hypothetical protein
MFNTGFNYCTYYGKYAATTALHAVRLTQATMRERHNKSMPYRRCTVFYSITRLIVKCHTYICVQYDYCNSDGSRAATTRLHRTIN